jgi:hypothetical protein
VLKELEEITQMYQQDKEQWNSLRATPQNISKKQNYLSKTGTTPHSLTHAHTRTHTHDTTRHTNRAAINAESMRIPLSPKDMIDLRGFTNVIVEEGGEQL